ncbi:3-oxoacyl-[acyl-carrier-protein] reductase [Christensenella tenuis]|jgi:3-oxoacyl-[acyl-carrier protein] reductase|uniref:3-oxoacyl-[acyl-carrier-protein] reductase n=1 Tax=Christensenella tenuis TaxID=2763033 RepID=A0ABR7EDB9_9FIRM|nr:3-oxoacyl-[acyl-carrier-protein] reductase [Christensenella tenuis]MBC5647746.1 3-oxoacyl-[acyl-carrier-protein] reductase [Christensenella tenuis]
MGTALITGASRGIGRELALRLAEEGYDIVVNYLFEEEDYAGTVAEIEKKGVKAVAIKADVSKFSEVEAMMKETVATFGTIDVLVNNAGITRDGLLARMKEEDFDAVINVNLKSVFNCCRHAVPYMMKQKHGRIISMASVVGLSGQGGQTNYSASKAGIIGFTKSLAKEIGSRNITVNAVAPGFVETPMTDAMPEKARAEVLGSIPLRRGGTVKDIADAVAFLASDQASYITGHVLSVNGGMYM